MEDVVSITHYCKDCVHGRKHNFNIIECMKAHDCNIEHQEFHHRTGFCDDEKNKKKMTVEDVAKKVVEVLNDMDAFTIAILNGLLHSWEVPKEEEGE